MLLDQCAHGWANNVIFTTEGSSDTTVSLLITLVSISSNARLSSLQIIRHCLLRGAPDLIENDYFLLTLVTLEATKELKAEVALTTQFKETAIPI